MGYTNFFDCEPFQFYKSFSPPFTVNAMKSTKCKFDIGIALSDRWSSLRDPSPGIADIIALYLFFIFSFLYGYLEIFNLIPASFKVRCVYWSLNMFTSQIASWFCMGRHWVDLVLNRVMSTLIYSILMRSNPPMYCWKFLAC